MATPSGHTIPTPTAVLTQELKYKPVEYKHGKKVWSQVMQQTGGQTVAIPIASTESSIFEIPSKALYLSDSFIRGIATPNAVAGANTTNWYHANQHLISEIHLTTRSNVPIVTLYNADKYRALTRGWHVPLVDHLCADPLDRFYPSRGTGATPVVGARMPIANGHSGSCVFAVYRGEIPARRNRQRCNPRL